MYVLVTVLTCPLCPFRKSVWLYSVLLHVFLTDLFTELQSGPEGSVELEEILLDPLRLLVGAEMHCLLTACIWH